MAPNSCLRLHHGPISEAASHANQGICKAEVASNQGGPSTESRPVALNVVRMARGPHHPRPAMQHLGWLFPPFSCGSKGATGPSALSLIHVSPQRSAQGIFKGTALFVPCGHQNRPKGTQLLPKWPRLGVRQENAAEFLLKIRRPTWRHNRRRSYDPPKDRVKCHNGHCERHVNLTDINIATPGSKAAHS
mmetsp:Transcript_11331/g.18633  ORF Transcript_11331/g.18633 Transcript_11331/m.18633 type:complete len:190 (-) Transcript_11331:1585-2154(-)